MDKSAQFRRQLLFPAPPKNVFQFLFDVTLLEEISSWKVEPGDTEVGVGFTWTEKRRLARRHWTMTEFDRRGFQFVATSDALELRMAAKKGGRGVCNVQMHVTGTPKAVAKFEATDGDRLGRLLAWLEG